MLHLGVLRRVKDLVKLYRYVSTLSINTGMKYLSTALQ